MTTQQSEEAAQDQLEAQLQHQVRKTERVNRDLEHIIHMVAHGLREPCRRQVALVDLLLDEHGHAVGPEIRSRLERITGQAETMLTMVTGFRMLAELSEQRAESVPVDLHALAMARLADAGLAPLDDAVRVDIGHRSEGDEVLLSILLDHLIQNAACHGSSPLTMELYSQEDEGRIVYVVENTIDEEDEPDGRDLLRAFVNGGAATAGPGLGLYICRRIVDRHDGDIWIEPVPGRFSVRFTLDTTP